MGDKLDVSIIIINYKTPKLCCDCIHSILEKSSGFTFEIIVIDNFSGDDSKEVVVSAFGNKIQFISNTENLGTAKAFNQGARLAQGKYLFYINTDTLLVNNAIFILKDYLDSNPNVGLVGGNLFNSKMEPTHSYRRRYGIKEYKKETSLFYLTFLKLFKKRLSMQFNYKGKPLEVSYICGADLLVRRNLYLSLGGFDEEIFIYGDESLFAYRCKQAGFSSYSVPAAKIIHFEGDSFKKDPNAFSEKRFLLLLKGTGISMEKAYGKGSKELFYRYSLKNRKKLLFIAKLIRKKSKANNIQKEISILEKVNCGEINL
jgi:GT2 family glycosyltransferase